MRQDKRHVYLMVHGAAIAAIYVVLTLSLIHILYRILCEEGCQLPNYVEECR